MRGAAKRRRDTGWGTSPRPPPPPPLPGSQIAQVSILSKMKALYPGPVSHADVRLEH